MGIETNKLKETGLLDFLRMGFALDEWNETFSIKRRLHTTCRCDRIYYLQRRIIKRLETTAPPEIVVMTLQDFQEGEKPDPMTVRLLGALIFHAVHAMQPRGINYFAEMVSRSWVRPGYAVEYLPEKQIEATFRLRELVKGQFVKTLPGSPFHGANTVRISQTLLGTLFGNDAIADTVCPAPADHSDPSERWRFGK